MIRTCSSSGQPSKLVIFSSIILYRLHVQRDPSDSPIPKMNIDMETIMASPMQCSHHTIIKREIVKVHWRLRASAHVHKVIVLQLRLRQIRFAGTAMNLRQSAQHILQHIQY